MKPGFLEVTGHYPAQLRLLSENCIDGKTVYSAVHCLEINGAYCLVSFSGICSCIDL